MKKPATRRKPRANPAAVAPPPKRQRRFRRNLGPLFANIEWDDEAQCYASWTDNHEFASSAYDPDEAFENLKEAIRAHIAVAKEFGVRLPLTAAQLRQLEQAVALSSQSSLPNKLSEPFFEPVLNTCERAEHTGNTCVWSPNRNER